MARTVFHGRLGATRICEEDEPDVGAGLGDNVNALLDLNGCSWRNATLVHKCSPSAGVLSTFLMISDGDGIRHKLRWTDLQLNPSAPPESERMRAKPFGVLADGRLYAVLRFLLYTDDFRAYTFKQGSCGGCYIMPMSIPPMDHHGVQAIRILGLTPPGVSTNIAIHAVVEDIVHGSSTGIPVKMADGATITLFLDVMGYLGDYPAMTHLLDVTGVTGSAPCNFCMFQRAGNGDSDAEDSITGEGSRYAYSTAIHSANLSFRRTRERMRICRAHAGVQDLKRIGLRDMDDEDVSNLPLHRLSNELDKVRNRVPCTADGVPVVPCTFDPYLSCYVGSDNGFYGLGEDISKAMLRQLTPQQS